MWSKSTGSPRHCPEPSGTDRYTAVARLLTDQQHVLRLKPRWVQLILHLLARKWYPDSPVIPSVPTLAREMACSDRTVQRAVDGLVGAGLLTVERRHRSDGGYTSNEYHLAEWLLAVVAPRDRPPDASLEPSRHHPGVTRGGRTTRYPNNRTRTTRQPVMEGHCFGCGAYSHLTTDCPRKLGPALRR